MIHSQTISLALLVFGHVHPALRPALLTQAAPPDTPPVQVEPATPSAPGSAVDVPPVAGDPGQASPAPESSEADTGPEASAGPVAPAETPVAEVGHSRSAGPVAAESDTAVASGETPAPEAAPAEPPAINPRPEGEEALLGKHPIEPSKSTYKPGTGAVLESADGLFSMGIRARVQFRDELYAYTETVDDGAGGAVDEGHVENTFGIRRARLQFKGHVFGKHNKYKLELAFSPNDMGYKNGTVSFTPLFDFYAEFDYLRDLSLRLGQYKIYYSRQRVISSGDLELVDRTLAQNEFNLDRDIGFHFFSNNVGGWNFLKYYAGITLGEGRDIWAAEDFNSPESAGAQYLARVEVLPFGDFDDYSEVDFERLNKFRLSIAAAYAFLNNGTKTRGYLGSNFADGGRVNYHNFNADLFFKWAGMTGLVEFYLRDGYRDSDVTPGDTANLPRNGIGSAVQVGYLLPGLPVGVAARYSAVGLGGFDPTLSSVEEAHEVGGGLSWYIAGHPLKLQGDYFHSWGDAFDGAGADRVRVQLQVAY